MRPHLAILFTILQLLSVPASALEQVNIYSAQKEHLIRPILDVFEKQSGIKVNVTTGKKAELISRLALEGKNTPADILLTADIGNIYQAKKQGLLQPIVSKVLTDKIPAHLRDPENIWYGFTVRARTIFYNNQLTNAEAIDSYLQLADPKWKGKLLIRSSSNIYNQSLVAFMLHQYGEEKTLAWAKGVVANMARPPQGGDTDQLRALAAGEGEIAVANTYYYGRLLGGDESVQDTHVQERVGIIFPDQQDAGMHVNIRGGGVTAHAKNKENAIKLLEFLTTDEAQKYFAHHNFEYPAVANVKAHPVVEKWMKAKQYDANLEALGKLQTQAVAIMDKAGWK
ncbi:MAG: extracellular solute-binding protein [Rickettsiales bacterium]